MKELQRICVHNDPYVLPFLVDCVECSLSQEQEVKNANVYVITFFFKQGKVEAELELLTQEEAEKKPAGRAREDPQALEKPK